MRLLCIGALAALLVMAAPPLAAELRPVGQAGVQVFDAGRKDFHLQACSVLYQDQPERLQVQVRGLKPGRPLNARVQLDALPHYAEWVAARQRDGGLAWKALAGLLGEVQGRPAVVLSLGPLPDQGRVELRVGLLKGSRFDLFGVVQAEITALPGALSFEILGLKPEKSSAQAAWAVLAPLARAQAARMAGQR